MRTTAAFVVGLAVPQTGVVHAGGSVTILVSLACAGAFAVLAAVWEGARPAFVALGGRLFVSPPPLVLASEEFPSPRAEAGVNVVVLLVTDPRDPSGNENTVR